MIHYSPLERLSKGSNIPQLQNRTASLSPDSPCGSCIPTSIQTVTILCQMKISATLRKRSADTESYHSVWKLFHLRMVRGVCLEFCDVMLVFLLLCSVTGLLQMDHRRDAEDDQELNKAILEMLHINKVSASHQGKPHPYMRRVYQHLDSLEAQDFGRSDGTLVQSFRSVVGTDIKLMTIWF